MTQPFTSQSVAEQDIVDLFIQSNKSFARWYRRRRKLIQQPVVFQVSDDLDLPAMTRQVTPDFQLPSELNLAVGTHLIWLRRDHVVPGVVAHELEHCIMAEEGWPKLTNTLGRTLRVPPHDKEQGLINVGEVFFNCVLDLEIDRRLLAFQLHNGRDLNGWKDEMRKVTDENTVKRLFALIPPGGCKTPAAARQCFAAFIALTESHDLFRVK